MRYGEGYFEYLLRLVGSGYLREQCAYMHEIPFEWWIDLDGNLESDGKALRDNYEYCTGYAYDGDDPMYATMFEVFVVLAQKMDGLIGGRDDTPASAFKVMMRNLDVTQDTTREEISAKLRVIVDRTYDRFGHGCLFPSRRGRIRPDETPLFDQLTSWCGQEKYII
jgi:hypothetical protein|nr:MAG TPA: hypothetical protein [Caudoviricetes sp.]